VFAPVPLGPNCKFWDLELWGKILSTLFGEKGGPKSRGRGGHSGRERISPPVFKMGGVSLEKPRVPQRNSPVETKEERLLFWGHPTRGG